MELQMSIVEEADAQYEAIVDCLLELYELCERHQPSWYSPLLGRRIEEALDAIGQPTPIIVRR